MSVANISASVASALLFFPTSAASCERSELFCEERSDERRKIFATGCKLRRVPRRNVVDSVQAASCGEQVQGGYREDTDTGRTELAGGRMLHAAASEQIQRLLQRVSAVLEVSYRCAESCTAHAGSYARKIQVRCRQKVFSRVHGVGSEERKMRGSEVRMFHKEPCSG